MKRLITLASLIALTATPLAAIAGGYQWTNKTIPNQLEDAGLRI